MKKLLLVPFVICSFIARSQSSDTLFHENFETGGSSFVLNTTDVSGVGTSGYNEWIINNVYAGGNGSLVCLGFPFNFTVNPTPAQPGGTTGGPNTNYLHTVSHASQMSGINNCCFLAADGLCNMNENYFTRMSSDISTVGYDTVKVSFLWLCSGGTNIHGEIYYSTNSGSSWNLITTPISQYKNQSSWTQQNITLAAFAGQSTLRFGFRFVNQTSSAANDPGFGIDEFLVVGKNAAPPLVAAFEISDGEICQGNCVDFADLSSGSPNSWLWIFQGASTAFSSQQNPSGICYANPGTYDVTLIVSNASGSDTLTLPSVTVHANPAQPDITLSNDTLYATPGFTAYQWFLDGNLIPGATGDFHVVLTDGVYTVTVTDANGCQAQSDPLNFSTGLAENSGTSVSIYPNPASDLITVILDQTGGAVMIYDITGRTVFNGEPMNEGINQIPVDTLSKGMYSVQINSKNSPVRYGRFIKW